MNYKKEFSVLWVSWVLFWVCVVYLASSLLGSVIVAHAGELESAPVIEVNEIPESPLPSSPAIEVTPDSASEYPSSPSVPEPTPEAPTVSRSSSGGSVGCKGQYLTTLPRCEQKYKVELAKQIISLLQQLIAKYQ